LREVRVDDGKKDPGQGGGPLHTVPGSKGSHTGACPEAHLGALGPPEAHRCS